MELVRAAALTGYFEVAEELRLDVVPLLRRAGLSRAMMNNPEQMLPAAVRRSACSRKARRRPGCMTFGLQDGGTPPDFGHRPDQPADRASADAARRRRNCSREYRNRINSTLTLQLEEHEEVVFLREHIRAQPAHGLAPGERCRAGRAVQVVPVDHGRTAGGRNASASATNARRCRSRDLRPAVRLPAAIRLGLSTGSSSARTTWTARSRAPDAALARHARELVSAIIDPGERTIARGGRAVDPAADAGGPGHHWRSRATRSGTNVRTLQRRLEEEGASFSDLLDRVRMQQVSQHFANRQLRLTDVAHLLGYSTLASFSAWYRGRFQETPDQGATATVAACGSRASERAVEGNPDALMSRSTARPFSRLPRPLSLRLRLVG